MGAAGYTAGLQHSCMCTVQSLALVYFFLLLLACRH
jgi:hypothetical protein